MSSKPHASALPTYSACSDILRTLRKIRPHRNFPADFADNNIKDLSTVENERGAELLRTLGQSRWKSLAESLEKNIAGPVMDPILQH